MTPTRKKTIHPIRRTKRWREIDELLRPLWPASNIQRLLAERKVYVTLRAIYNWRSRGVSEEATVAIASMAGVSVEEVLRASGKL